jgi:hypothetical protein
LALETFSRTIDVITLCSFFTVQIQSKCDVIQVLSGFNVIEASDDNAELLVKAEWKFLDSFFMWKNLNTRTSLHDELCDNIGFKATDISLSEEELPV